MRVKSLVDHFNDYSTEGPGSAVGGDRLKAKGSEYDIHDEAAAKQLIDDGTVERAAAKK